jgi:hypothetical protein
VRRAGSLIQNWLAVCGRSWSLVTMSVHSHTRPAAAGSRGLPVVECYVSRAELAAIMGVSLATVDRMVAEGMPSVTWGRRTRRFRPSAALCWAIERGRAA